MDDTESWAYRKNVRSLLQVSDYSDDGEEDDALHDFAETVETQLEDISVVSLPEISPPESSNVWNVETNIVEVQKPSPEFDADASSVSNEESNPFERPKNGSTIISTSEKSNLFTATSSGFRFWGGVCICSCPICSSVEDVTKFPFSSSTETSMVTDETWSEFETSTVTEKSWSESETSTVTEKSSEFETSTVTDKSRSEFETSTVTNKSWSEWTATSNSSTSDEVAIDSMTTEEMVPFASFNFAPDASKGKVECTVDRKDMIFPRI